MDEKNLHEGHRKRMRKRMISGSHFSPHELLEMLISYGIPRKNTNDIAHRLMARFETLDGVFSASYEELMSVRGVGENCAVLIGLVGLLTEARRDEEDTRIRLETVGKMGEYAKMLFRGMTDEAAYAILLDSDLYVTDCVRLAGGTVSSVSVDIGRSISELSLHRSCAVVLLHNHPNGNLSASEEDLEFASRATEIFALSGIKVVEHILVSGNRFLTLMGEMTPEMKMGDDK